MSASTGSVAAALVRDGVVIAAAIVIILVTILYALPAALGAAGPAIAGG